MANNHHWPLPTLCDSFDEIIEAKRLQEEYFLNAVGSPCSRSDSSHLLSTLPHHGERVLGSFGADYHASGGMTDQSNDFTAWGSSKSNNGMALSDMSHSPRLPPGTENLQIAPTSAQAIAIEYGTNAFAPPSDGFGSGISGGVYSGSAGTSASFQGADGSSFTSASSHGGAVEDDGSGGVACLSAFQAAGPQYHLSAGDSTPARPMVGSDGTLSPRDLHFQNLPSPMALSDPQFLKLEDDGDHADCFALEPWHPAEKAVTAPFPAASNKKGPKKSASKPLASRLNSKPSSKQKSARRSLPSKASKTGRNSSSSKTEPRKPSPLRRTSATRLGLAPHRKVLPVPATPQPWPSKARETTAEKQTSNNESSWTDDFDARTADRTAKDEYLVKCKLDGMPYRQIRAEGKFAEAESTLRGRFRSLTKSKENRVRKPEWTDKDVKLLREAVGKLAREDNSGSPKIPWKEVASYIREKGGSYLFGNATCHKKWEELAGDIP